MMATLTIVGCSKEENLITSDPPKLKEYVISLGFSGEITNIENTPLTKAVTEDLYGIQVYSKASENEEYQPYAYGLFDNIDNLSINLLENHIYKFESTMVVDGKNKLPNFGYGYSYPFMRGSEYSKINSNFNYSSTISFQFLRYGRTDLEVNNTNVFYERPNTDRYYGEYLNYTPTEKGNININMKRVSFGVTFKSEGLTEGKLEISLKGAPELYIIYGESTEVSDIFTFVNLGNGTTWISDDYAETVPVLITWEKADKAIIPIVRQDITFKRNQLTTVTILVSSNTNNNSTINISKEDTPLIDGDKITVGSN